MNTWVTMSTVINIIVFVALGVQCCSALRNYTAEYIQFNDKLQDKVCDTNDVTSDQLKKFRDCLGDDSYYKDYLEQRKKVVDECMSQVMSNVTDFQSNDDKKTVVDICYYDELMDCHYDRMKPFMEEWHKSHLRDYYSMRQDCMLSAVGAEPLVIEED